MRVAIVYSINDPVGSSVAPKITEILKSESASCPHAKECKLVAGKYYLAGYEQSMVNFEFLDKTPDPEADVVIVLSRHSSTSGRPTLSTHHTGNPTKEAGLGGKPERLAWSAPPLNKLLLSTYREQAEEMGLLSKYEITLEATHHGPTDNSKPLVFIEIGSTPEEWKNEKAQWAMAYTVAISLETPLPKCRLAAGYGGTHYPRKFTKLHLEEDYCFGHIIPKYAFQKGVSRDVLEQSIIKTWPKKVEIGVIEKKSLKSIYRKQVEKVLSDMGIAIERL